MIASQPCAAHVAGKGTVTTARCDMFCGPHNTSRTGPVTTPLHPGTPAQDTGDVVIKYSTSDLSQWQISLGM